MKFLRSEEYLPYAPDNVGKVRINHTSPDCSGGRSSMTVRRHEDGSVSAFCYRCGRGGKWAPEYARTKRAKQGGSGEVVVKHPLQIPEDITYDMNDWPLELRVWMLRSITEQEANEHHFVYSEQMGGVIMPIDNNNHVCRMIKGNNKYLSYLTDKEYIYNNKGGRLVIVEDYLSYIKVGRVGSVLCLLGTKLKDSALLAIAGRHKEFVVFLDNDNNIVKQKQTAIAKRLRMFGKVRVVKHHTDPKNCSEEEIIELIGGGV